MILITVDTKIYKSSLRMNSRKMMKKVIMMTSAISTSSSSKE